MCSCSSSTQCIKQMPGANSLGGTGGGSACKSNLTRANVKFGIVIISEVLAVW